MSHVTHDLWSLLPFALLLVAVIGLWMHPSVWICALLAASLAGLGTHALTGNSVFWLLLLALSAAAYRREKSRPAGRFPKLTRLAAGLVFFGLALAIGLLLIPGFERVALTDNVVLSPGATPYGIGLGFSKLVAGILIIGVINPARVRSWAELGAVLKRAAPVFLMTLIAVMACALLLGYTRFDPKWTTLFLIWAPVNLFFTCLSEEAFFRGFIQHEISQLGARRRFAAAAGLIVGAVTFGLAHLAGGWKYALAATVAGFGYGWAYHRTQRIEASMAVHFGVNAVHFLLFAYPALASPA